MLILDAIHSSLIALVNNERPPLPDLDKPVAVGLKVSVLDKLLPDFADKPSTVGLEVEDLDKLLPDFPDKPSTVGLEVEGLAVFGLDVVGLAVTGLTVGPTVGFMDER